MSTLSGLISGGGGGGGASIDAKVRTYTIKESGSFVFPFSGTVDIYAIGGGGIGGLGTGGINTPSQHYNFCSIATGGGAGGTAVKRNIEVTAGDKITISAGASAEMTFGTDARNDQTVTNAGATTINSNDITISLTANGGGNGSASTSENGSISTASLSGGTGGTGSGGDDNYTGGRGGNFTFTATPNVGNGYNAWAGQAATGGGGVGLAGTGGHGGDAEIELNTGAGGSSSEVLHVVTGGGAVGVDASTVTANAGGDSYTGTSQKIYGGAGATQGFEIDVTGEYDTGTNGNNISASNLGDFGYANSVNSSEQFSMPSRAGGQTAFSSSNYFVNGSGGMLSGNGGQKNIANSPMTVPQVNTRPMGFGGGGGFAMSMNTDGNYGTRVLQDDYGFGHGGCAYAGYALVNNYSNFYFSTNLTAGAGCCIIEYKTISL